MITVEQVETLADHCATWEARDHSHVSAAERVALDRAMAVAAGMAQDLALLQLHLRAEAQIDDGITRSRHAEPSNPVEVPADVMAKINAHARDLSGFGVS